jgi:hypothetical protein
MAEKPTLTYDEAADEVRLVSRRIALLHLAFSQAAIARLGEAAGRRLVVDAIRIYGTLIGREVRDAVVRQGLEPAPENFGVGDSRCLPRMGMHAGSETVEIDGETRLRAHGCAMADVWERYGAEAQELGRLYCLVDPAKYMAYNPRYTLAHTRAKPSGDAFCEFLVRETTAEERRAFAAGEQGWTSADRRDEEKPDGR